MSFSHSKNLGNCDHFILLKHNERMFQARTDSLLPPLLARPCLAMAGSSPNPPGEARCRCVGGGGGLLPSAETLIEGKKAHLIGKNSVAWLEANPYDIHYCLSVQSVFCYKNQLHSII